jgi:hypothetical protein
MKLPSSHGEFLLRHVTPNRKSNLRVAVASKFYQQIGCADHHTTGKATVVRLVLGPPQIG